MSLFQEHKTIPSHASARIKRWALTLAGRLLLTDTIEMTPVPAEMILTLDYLQEAPITAEQIRSWTNKDQLLSLVVQFIQQGWPEHCAQPELKPYWCRRTELTCFKGCIMWGAQVVVPAQGHTKLLQGLHIPVYAE